ncbi:MAG: tetratricopeptide repeat protein [Fusobacteriaceae bacterium]
MQKNNIKFRRAIINIRVVFQYMICIVPAIILIGYKDKIFRAEFWHTPINGKLVVIICGAILVLLFTYYIRHENKIKRARAINDSGLKYFQEGEYEQALEIFNDALKKFEKIFKKNSIDIAIIYNNIGDTYYELKKYSEANNFYKKSIDVKKIIYGEKHNEICLTYNKIGNSYHMMDEYDVAIKFYKKALATLEKIKRKNISFDKDKEVIYYSLSSSYGMLGDSKVAIYYIEKSLEILKKLYGENSVEVAIVMEDLRDIYFEQGLMEKYNECKEIINKIFDEVEKNEEMQ